MRTEHLRYLIEIDKQHSISAAAQELHIGQTTLSSILKSVEEELGFKIFQRTRSGVQITPEGEEALALIWEINHRLEEIQMLSQSTYAPAQPITVISSPTILSGLALPLNDAFLSKDPTGNLDFYSISGEEVGAKLIKNEANIGATYFTEQSLENYRIIASKYQVKVDVLYKDHLYLLVSRNHPLAALDSIACGDLEQLSFASLPNYRSGDGFLAHFKIFGDGNRYTTFSDVAQIKRAVLQQNMVAILSGYAIQYNHSVDNSNFKVLQLTRTKYENEMYLGLIHRSDSNLRYQEKLVVQCIKEYFENLPIPPFAVESKKEDLQKFQMPEEAED